MTLKYIARVAPTSGEVVSMSFAKGANNPPEGEDFETNLHVIYISEELGPLDLWMETHYRDFSNNTWATRSAKPNPVAYWNGSSWITELEQFKDLVREQRDSKLSYSDWTQFIDVPLSTEQKQSWATYRQSLRDLPTTITSSITRLEDVTWPTEPS